VVGLRPRCTASPPQRGLYRASQKMCHSTDASGFGTSYRGGEGGRTPGRLEGSLPALLAIGRAPELLHISRRGLRFASEMATWQTEDGACGRCTELGHNI
jgi:hypothetical protein